MKNATHLLEQLQEKIADYKLHPDTKELVQETNVVLLVGISGAGKDTIKHELLKDSAYHHIVSHTTRSPRLNNGMLEHDGVEYHFIDIPTALTMLDNNGFVEAKFYTGNLYGTSVGEIRLAHDEGKIAITDVEVLGVQEFHDVSKEVRPIFILPPDFDTWQQRLLSRYGETPDPADLAKRLQTAKMELEFVMNSNYFYTVINEDLQDAISEVDAIAKGHRNAGHAAHGERVMKDILRHL